MLMTMTMAAPAAKLATLLILLPLCSTYFHLYYNAFVRNELCFVGPHVSPVSGREYYPPTTSLLAGTAAVDEGVASTSTNEDARAAASSLSGSYSPSQTKGKKKKDLNKRAFVQRHSPSSGDSWGWPSVTQASAMLDKSIAGQDASGGRINFDEDGMRWCVGAETSSTSWCSTPLSVSSDDVIYNYPPSGLYQSTSPAGLLPPLRVSCPGPATSDPPVQSKHKAQNRKQNQNVQFVLRQPSTCAIMLLNVALAFHYWNRRVDPSSVCKQYARIVDEHEWWRGLTGATAHFEPLHIGFNMMSMNTLGREIEGSLLTSVEFLMWNIALVVYTTVAMMAMVYARIRYLQRKIDTCNNSQIQATYEEKQEKLRNTSSVGYSAVLFAWMVISTMERKQPTCPIPFVDDVCFSTYEVPGLSFLRFNLSPIVSLFVCQFIMPRVSFMGHLAGIVAGFLLHWGLLPPLELSSVNVLIGGVFLLGLWSRRGAVPVKPLLAASMDEEGGRDHNAYIQSIIDEIYVHQSEAPYNRRNAAAGSDDQVQQSKQRKKDRELREVNRKQRTLLSIRNLMAAALVGSFCVNGWASSLVLSQCVLLLYFTFAVRSTQFVWAYTHSRVEDDILAQEKVRSGMIWRGFLMSAVISIVIDSMSLASWVCLPLMLETFQDSWPPSGLLPVCIFTVVLRIGVNLIGLVVASKILHDTVQVGGGIFTAVFSPVLTSSRLIGDSILTTTQVSLWTAFEGRGTRLGARSG